MTSEERMSLGWDAKYLREVLNVMTDIDKTQYELRNCVRACYTEAERYDELQEHLKNLGERLIEAAENIQSDADELDDEAFRIQQEEEELQIWSGLYDEDELEGYEIVCWPESQDLMEIEGYRRHSYLIDDDFGIDKYGSSAYVVEKEWFDNAQEK